MLNVKVPAGTFNQEKVIVKTNALDRLQLYPEVSDLKCNPWSVLQGSPPPATKLSTSAAPSPTWTSPSPSRSGGGQSTTSLT